jgi:acetyltransferase-like isoleucine patch superfamily enzyme
MSGVMMGGYVKVEDFSTIGTSAIILPNLTIGTGSIIGAGSVVTKNVEPYSVVVGSPAKHVRTTKLSFDNSHLTVLYKQFTQS